MGLSAWGRAGVLGLLAALLVLGAATVVRFHVWADVDERAHYSFVQSVAEDRRLPAIDDPVSPEVQAITDRTWPRPSPRPPQAAGLAGRSYEAFQPPLYYGLAAPAFHAVPDHRDKVLALRAFDLALLLGAVAVLAALARALYQERGARTAALIGAALVLLWPGVVVRAVTVSNTPLELVLAPALLLALWKAWQGGSARWWWICGALLGLALLTKLTLVYLLAPVAVMAAGALRGRGGGAGRGAILAGLAVPPALLLLPWLAGNLERFGALTQNAAAREQQEPVLFPGGAPSYVAGDVPGRLGELARGALPQEWAEQFDVAGVGAVAVAPVLALGLGAALVAVCHPSRPLLLVTTPVLAGVAMMVAVLLRSDWDIFLLRYLYPVLPPLAMVVAVGVWRLAPGRLAVGLTAAGAGLLAVLWIRLAGAYWFTDVGRSLGIA